MSKTQELATAFLEKTRLTRPTAPPISGVVNAFNALFAVQELSDPESRAIERLMVEGYEPGQISEEDVNSDVVEVKRLTKELMAIRRQEMILIGERIAQARAIFIKYKERSFREWLNLTFGSFKTGYNYLSFYELYLLVPDDVKGRLKEMPAKAVYVLASKKMSVERKIEIVKEHGQETAQNLISLIKQILGDGSAPKGPSNERLISSIERDLLSIRPDLLSDSQKRRLNVLVEHIKNLIDHSKK